MTEPRVREAARVMPIPDGLLTPGTRWSPFEQVASVSDLGPGQMMRISRDDLDILLVHTDVGVAAIEDRCPHQAAPLSFGTLDSCRIACPLHSGTFDLLSGEPIAFPTTGGLDPSGNPIEPWLAPGARPRPAPTDIKVLARLNTRVRRLRYFPVRIQGEVIELGFPRA